MIKVDKNIPIPETRGAGTKYPFRIMDIGDSFAAPVEKHTSLVASAHTFGRRAGLKFTVRKLPTESRVWRIA